jgi:hypothetical protein
VLEAGRQASTCPLEAGTRPHLFSVLAAIPALVALGGAWCGRMGDSSPVASLGLQQRTFIHLFTNSFTLLI